MRIVCKKCKSGFELDKEQLDFFEKSKAKKMTFIMLECSNCWHTTDYNPTNLRQVSIEKEITWRTPISRVNGFVSFVENNDENFYGCGESGFIWLTKERFYKSIEEIISQYPHRASCYLKIDGDWFPNKDETENIEELIAGEIENDLTDFVIE